MEKLELSNLFPEVEVSKDVTILSSSEVKDSKPNVVVLILESFDFWKTKDGSIAMDLIGTANGMRCRCFVPFPMPLINDLLKMTGKHAVDIPDFERSKPINKLPTKQEQPDKSLGDKVLLMSKHGMSVHDIASVLDQHSTDTITTALDLSRSSKIRQYVKEGKDRAWIRQELKMSFDEFTALYDRVTKK